MNSQQQMSWSYYVPVLEVRGGCSFCCYWWNCGPSLFNLFCCHNTVADHYLLGSI